MNDKQFLQLIQQDLGSKESPTPPATQNTAPGPQQNAGSTPPPVTQNTTPESLDSDQAFARLIEQDLKPDADKLQEAGEASVYDAGDLPNPFTPQDATDTQQFNQAVASAEITAPTPEEIQKQILVDYPNWKPIQRKVSQEEKDSGLWGTRWLTADTEYGFELPDGSVWSINKPGLSWGDIRATAIQEFPYAIASALTGGGTMAVRAIRTALAMGGVNVGQQAYNVKWGGREAIDPLETALVAGASGLAEPAFAAAGWGLRKMGQGLGYIVPGSAKIKAGAAKATNTARKSLNNILAKNGQGPQLPELTAEELLELEALEKQAYRGKYDRVLTPEQFKKELKQATDDATGFKHIDKIEDIPLTSAEEVFDPVRGPTRQHQTEATKKAMDEEKRLAGVEKSLLEDTLDIRNERIAELLTQEGGLLSGEGIAPALNTKKAHLGLKLSKVGEKLKDLGIDLKTKNLLTDEVIEKLGDTPEKMDLLKEAQTIKSDIEFTSKKLKNMASPMTVEETAENLGDSLKIYSDTWDTIIKTAYDDAKAAGKKINMSVFEKDLIPYDIQLSNTPTVRKVYEQFIKMLKSDDTFTMLPDGTQKSAIRPRTMDELELARRYLRDNISELKKDGATFHEGEQLQKVYDKFLQNIENLTNKHASGKTPESKLLAELFGKELDKYFTSANYASEQFKKNKEMFNDKGFLTKVVDRIEKGETTPKQLLGMFLSTTGQPNSGMGQTVISKIKEHNLQGPLKEALLFNLLVEPSATGVSGKNLRLGQSLISRWNNIKNNTQIKHLFDDDDEWEELNKAMNKLTRVDVSRREGQINSATADRMLKGLRDTISNATIPGKIFNRIFREFESGLEDIKNQKGIQKVLVEMADEHNRPITVRGKPAPLRNVASTGAVLETNEEETK